MEKASASKRFLAFIIDQIIIGIVAYLIGLLIPSIGVEPIEPISNGNSIEYPQLYDYYVNHKDDTLGWTYELDSNGDTELSIEYKAYLKSEEYQEYTTDLTKYELINLVPELIIGIVLFSAYYCVLGYFWSKQTVGRMLLKIRVVDYDDEKPTLGALFLRDLVGWYLISSLCCGIPVIINIFMICGQSGQSIGDQISRTKMIDDSKKIDDSTLNYETSSHHSDFEEAEVVDETKKENKDEEIW